MAAGHQLAYVGDVVGTGSSRKSATNSVRGQWAAWVQRGPGQTEGTAEQLKRRIRATFADRTPSSCVRDTCVAQVLWFMGDDMPYVPNKRAGGVCIGNKIAPIFFNTMEDSGMRALPCEMACPSLQLCSSQ